MHRPTTKDESGLYSEVLANGEIERFSFFMDVKSVITHPSGQQILPEAHGYYEIAGLAWSGYGRITRVEVSGRWRPELGRRASARPGAGQRR